MGVGGSTAAGVDIAQEYQITQITAKGTVALMSACSIEAVLRPRVGLAGKEDGLQRARYAGRGLRASWGCCAVLRKPPVSGADLSFLWGPRWLAASRWS